MNYAEIKLTIDAIENPLTDCRDLLKRLIDGDYLNLQDVFTIIGNGSIAGFNSVINGISTSPNQYTTYSNLNKIGQTIPAIKAIRSDFGLGLKEAKDINDIIKDCVCITAKCFINGIELTKEQYSNYVNGIGNKINVIRMIRQDHNIGLKEAKDIADTIQDRARLGIASF